MPISDELNKHCANWSSKLSILVAAKKMRFRGSTCAIGYRVQNKKHKNQGATT